MATGSALNLSLLSRGVGEVTRNGTEKVDVIFEPQDYFNFVEESHERPFFLPPLQPRYGFASEPSQLSSRYSSKDAVHLPKTFTTRKGALLLFSEDMAHKTKASEAKKHKHHHGYHSDRDITISSIEESTADRDLKTVDDLARSILAYGSIDESGNMNLKVMAQKKKRRYDFERQIRPGFSAKRYLSTWTKTWDDTTLEKVISKGYLTEKSLFYYNPLLPHLSRRLNDDLSHYPTPYKLMRSMLMSPGSLSGYTFYRVRPESQETDFIEIEDEDEIRTITKSRQAGSVKVASVMADGQLKEAIYSQLDRQAQAEVLTDLLVKGAVHYAMKTQQEYADRILEESEAGSEAKVVPKFDMREAVESMLQSNDQRGIPQQTLDANLPERDDRSQHSGSFKGGKLGLHRLREKGQGDGMQWRDDASSASSGGAPGPLPSGHAPLPPIGQTYTQLTPIGEASREHTQAFSLPVNEKDEKKEMNVWLEANFNMLMVDVMDREFLDVSKPVTSETEVNAAKIAVGEENHLKDGDQLREGEKRKHSQKTEGGVEKKSKTTEGEKKNDTATCKSPGSYKEESLVDKNDALVQKRAQKDLAEALLLKRTKAIPEISSSHKDCVSRKEFLELKDEVRRLKKKLFQSNPASSSTMTTVPSSPELPLQFMQTPSKSTPLPLSPLQSSLNMSPTPPSLLQMSPPPHAVTQTSSAETYNGHTKDSLRDVIAHMDKLYLAVKTLLLKLFPETYIISHSVSGKASNSKTEAKPSFDPRLYAVMVSVLKDKFNSSSKEITEKVHSVQKFIQKKM